MSKDDDEEDDEEIDEEGHLRKQRDQNQEEEILEWLPVFVQDMVR